MGELIRFLPSYVGSKRAWVPYLQEFAGRPFVEMFAGSAVLSANLATKALLVDLDPIVATILSRFDEQIVPESFTREDYYRVRFEPDWWQHAYCLQSMSFSGVFRYSKRGYNVPAKGGADPEKNKVNVFHNQPSYERALLRWNELQPDVRQSSYLDITDDEIAALGDDVIIVLDPPYEGSQAAYNAVVGTGEASVNNNEFDFNAYWERVEQLRQKFDIILFDRKDNIERHGYHVDAVRKMRVNGARPGDVEAMSVLLRSGERRFNTKGHFDLWEGKGDVVVVK